MSRTSNGEFVFLLDDHTQATYNDYYHIPKDLPIKQVIKFAPSYPPPPHTLEEHIEWDNWNKKFHELLERARCLRQQQE